MAQIKFDEFEASGVSKLKNKIILCHTSRNVDEYLTAIKHRQSKKIPNYIVTRNGNILNLLQDSEYSLFFRNQELNQKSIIVSLENLGWLEKIPLKKHYINWLGNIYEEPVFEKKWRDYFYWEPYTKNQLEIIPQLCKEICRVNPIEYKSIGHNVKIKMVEDYGGIFCRANFDQFSTDLNPSFDFGIFK